MEEGLVAQDDYHHRWVPGRCLDHYLDAFFVREQPPTFFPIRGYCQLIVDNVAVIDEVKELLCFQT